MRLKPIRMGTDEAKPVPKDGESRIARLQPLDAARGIFSIYMIIGHCCLTMSVAGQHLYGTLLMLTPLRFGWALVTVFFVLSGFVLALPYFGPKPPGYMKFLIKRVSRLYIPYAIITIAAFLLYVATDTSPQAIDSMLLHIEDPNVPSHFTLPMLARMLAMTGLRKDNLINPGMWSLVHEMRISLIFPLLVLLCRRSWLAIPVMIACYVFGAYARLSLGHYTVFPAITDDYLTTWMTTVYILPCFMFGILLAKYKDRMVDFLADQSALMRRFLWVLVFVNLSFLPDFQIPHPFTEFGAALFIPLLLSSDTLADAAEGPVFQWLGRISYSTYLVHIPILFVLRRLYEGQVLLFWLFLACFVLTFPLATLSQRFIERPARARARKWVRAIP